MAQVERRERRPWTPEEDAKLKQYREMDPPLSVQRIGVLLNRAHGSVNMRIHKIGLEPIKHRQPKEQLERHGYQREAALKDLGLLVPPSASLTVTHHRVSNEALQKVLDTPKRTIEGFEEIEVVYRLAYAPHRNELIPVALPRIKFLEQGQGHLHVV